MAQATMIGLCSDNVLTILQPSSIIECLGGDVTSGTFTFVVPANGSVILPLTPGNYILSINLTDLPDRITALSILVGGSKFPVFIPTTVDSSTTVSVSCNYSPAISLLISVEVTPVVTNVLSGSVFYTRVD